MSQAENEEYSYDTVPYESHPYARTHPDRLCTIGKLFGMTPAHPTSCRVLELGCASGGNIIPMAEQLANSEFVGVDLSERQVAEGCERIEKLGLRNIKLLQGDIQDIDESYGTFDYVICHGVYSWVPREVQDGILAACRYRLQPQGIAYISFNTYPGWHMRESVRHMMRYHAARFETPEDRVGQSFALLEFLVEQLAESDAPHAQHLKHELEVLQNRADFYLYHEHLEEVNTPCYFSEFAAHLKQFDLQYLGDTDVSLMLGRELSEKARETLGRIVKNIIQMEQYMDFVRNRQFRTTLVCHQSVSLERHLDGKSLKGMRFALQPTQTQPPVTLDATNAKVYETFHGYQIRTVDPLLDTVLAYLIEQWPRSVDMQTLTNHARERLKDDFDLQAAENAIATGLLQIIGDEGVLLRSWETPFAVEVEEYPYIRASSRLSARLFGFVTDARHERVTLDPAVVHLVQLLDGTHNRDALLEKMVEKAKKDMFKLTLDSVRITTDDELHDGLIKIIDATLFKFARSMVLTPRSDTFGCVN